MIDSQWRCLSKVLLGQWSDAVVGTHSEQLHFGVSEVFQLACVYIKEKIISEVKER